MRLNKDARPTRTWLLSVASFSKVTKELHVVRHKFLSDAVTIDEAFRAIYDEGFACVQKIDGRIIPFGGLQVRLSTGELNVPIHTVPGLVESKVS